MVPKREDWIRIPGELFPDADGYVVVDDLDLSHVDEWEHHYAWDFVDLVQNGKIELPVPSSNDPVPDGGFESVELGVVSYTSHKYRHRLP